MPVSTPAPPPFASATLPGLVSTGPQTWGGIKSLTNILNLAKIATGSLPAAAPENEGAVAYDDTTNTLKFSNGSSWTELSTTAGSFVSKTGDSMSGNLTISKSSGSTILSVTSTDTAEYASVDVNSNVGALTLQAYGSAAAATDRYIGRVRSSLFLSNGLELVSASNTAGIRFYVSNGLSVDILAATLSHVTKAATFEGNIAAPNYSGIHSGTHSGTSSGTNSGDVTLGAVGAVPNANGASLSSQVLTLQPANGSFPGVVTTVAQTFLGIKSFSDILNLPKIVTASLPAAAPGNEGAIAYDDTTNTVKFSDGSSWTNVAAGGAVTTMAAIGAVPNANGASISGVTLTLQPANASFGGVWTTGAQTLPGDKTLSGVTTLSGASGNTLVVDTNTFVVDATNNRVGVGTASPGTANGSSFDLVQTLSTVAGTTQIGMLANITTSSGSSGRGQIGHELNLLAGYTGAFATYGFVALNSAAGTASSLIAGGANFGTAGQSNPTTVGNNVGVYGQAEGGALSAGLYGQAMVSKASATNIGVLGQALNGGASGVQIGGMFLLSGSNPGTFTNTALLADNGNQTSPIFLARDNGTTVFSIADGGQTDIVSASAAGGLFRLKTTSASGFAEQSFLDSSGSGVMSLGYGNASASAPFASKGYLQIVNKEFIFMGGAAGATQVGGFKVNGDWYWDTNVLYVDAGNNRVGINNAGPTASLDVTGTVAISSTLNVTGVVTFGAASIYKGATGITAFATGGQTSATALTAEVNFVTTVATAADSVKLPVAALGAKVVVFNDGANSVNIFPVSGSSIDALGTDVAYALAAGLSREFWGKSTTVWKSR